MTVCPEWWCRPCHRQFINHADLNLHMIEEHGWSPVVVEAPPEEEA